MSFETYAIPKEFIVVDEPKPRVCGNCRWWEKIDSEENTYCTNPDMPIFVSGGISEPVKAEFGCVLFEESEVAEGE